MILTQQSHLHQTPVVVPQAGTPIVPLVKDDSSFLQTWSEQPSEFEEPDILVEQIEEPEVADEEAIPLGLEAERMTKDDVPLHHEGDEKRAADDEKVMKRPAEQPDHETGSAPVNIDGEPVGPTQDRSMPSSEIGLDLGNHESPISSEEAAFEGVELSSNVIQTNLVSIPAEGGEISPTGIDKPITLSASKVEHSATVVPPLRSVEMPSQGEPVIEHEILNKKEILDKDVASTDDPTDRQQGIETTTAKVVISNPTPLAPPTIAQNSVLLAMPEVDQEISAVPLDEIALENDVPTSTTTLPSTTGPSVTGGVRTATPTVVQQIAAALAQSSGQSTQIALNPEELGRVRISLSTNETGLMVNIVAERPETAELMRRNIDSLLEDFSDLGYDNPSFNFHSDGENHQKDSQESPPEPSKRMSVDISLSHPALPAAVLTPLGGLDLKL